MKKMAKKKKLPKSIRVFIRQEKSRIRRGFLDVKKQKELTEELYKKLITNKIKSVQKNED